MKNYIISTAIAVAFSAGMATAQEFKGDITLSYSAFTEDTSVNRLSAEGSFEFGLSHQASVQLDLGLYGFGATNLDNTNIVLHGIFDVHPQGSAGLFIGMEDLNGFDINFYGVEYGQSFGTGSVEVYLARGEEAGIEGTVVGIAGMVALSDSFGLGVKIDNADFNGAIDATRFGVKGEYALGQGSSVYGEVGALRASGFGFSDSEPFVGVGLSIDLGSDEATFGRRGLFHLIPGL